MNMDVLTQQIAGKAEYFFRKHGPALLTAAGVSGFAVSNYLTAKAVLKSQDKIKAAVLKSSEIKAKDVDDSYTKEQKARELGQHWVREGLNIGKDFAPAMATGSIAIVCVISSHRLMHNRQAALAAAYATVAQAFQAYRKRVQEEVGEERELELYRGPRFKEIHDADGDLLSTEIDPDDLNPSIYGRYFDASCPPWNKSPEYNAMFLKSQQQWFNNRLVAHGFVFLNEVYEALGFPRMQYGQVVGWKRDAKEKGTGDGFVSFGIDNIYDENARAFINGHEPVVHLDFNVDGPIIID